MLSSWNAKLLSLLIVGIFLLSSTKSSMVSIATIRTPSIPPCERRASLSWCAVVTSFPSLIKSLTWDLHVAANLSAAPFPPCGSEKSIRCILLRFWVLWEINSRFCSKTQWQMFLLVSCRHVGAHVDGHQHGVSIQISINLRKTFLRISSIRKIAVTWILARFFVYLPSFYFQILD